MAMWAIPALSTTSVDGRRTRVFMNSLHFRLLSTRDVADLLGVSARTVEDWRALSVGPPYIRMGTRTVRYRSDSLEEWIASRQSDTTPSSGVRADGPSA